MTRWPWLALGPVWPRRTLGLGLALWFAAARRTGLVLWPWALWWPGPGLWPWALWWPGPGEGTGRARIGELGELGGGRDRPDRAARRDGRRVADVQRRRLAVPLGATTDRPVPAGVADRPELTRVRDGVEPIRVA